MLLVMPDAGARLEHALAEHERQVLDIGKKRKRGRRTAALVWAGLVDGEGAFLDDLGSRGSRGRGRGLRAERPVRELAESHLAGAGGIERGTQAQEVVPDVVVVAGHFHAAVVLHPVLAVDAVVNRHDVAVVPESDVQRPIDLARPALQPIEAVAVHDEVAGRIAEARVEPLVVEQQQAGGGPGIALDLDLHLVRVVARHEPERRAVRR